MPTAPFTPPTPPRTGQTVLLHLALVVLVGLLAYSNSLHGPFVFDDISNIQNNPVVRDLALFADLDALTRAAGHADAIQHAVRTRYLSYLSFALNYRLHGLETFGYHLVNLLIHLGNALLVYLLAGQMTRLVQRSQPGQIPRAAALAPLAAALLFVSHPLQTQAVSYIVQRMTSLATLFLLLALVAYLGALLADRASRRCGLLLAALACGLLGVLSKEYAALLPLFALGLETLQRGPSWRERCARVLVVLPVALVPPLLLFGFGRGATRDAVGDITAGPSLSSLEYLLTQMRVIPRYLQLLLWPAGQSIDHDVTPARALLDSGVLPGALLVILLLALLLWATLRSARVAWLRLPVTAGWLFWLALLPESSLFPIADVIFEHRLYFPLVWLALLVGFLLAPLHDRLPPARRPVLVSLVGLLVLALAATSWARNRVWSDAELLWRDAVAKSPQKARPANNLAKELERQQRYAEALPLYARAAELAPNDARIRFNLARNLHRDGQVDAALGAYRETLGLDPAMEAAYYNLARLALTRRDRRTAEQAFTHYLRLTGDQPAETARRLEAHHLLANLLRDQRRYAEAERHYRAALQLATTPAQLDNDYGIALAEQGRYAEAETVFRRAVAATACYSEAYNNLGALLLTLDRSGEAGDAFRQALLCDPANRQARANLERLQ